MTKTNRARTPTPHRPRWSTSVSRPHLDATDHNILKLLQEDAGRTDADLARRIDLSASGLKKRLRKLERQGVIERRVTLLDRNSVDLGILCYVQVFMSHHQAREIQPFADRVGELDEVLECHIVTGEHDYLLKVVAHDYQHLEHILTRGLATVPGVDRLLTSIVLNEVKSTTALPIDGPSRRIADEASTDPDR